MGLFDKKYTSNSFPVGLGVHIYHLVPSKHILDILSQFGLSCSYNDIRQITTALAKREILDKDIYVPQNLQQINAEEKNYIHASIDNFDLNEETIDGKRTTHAMATVVFQKQSAKRLLGDRIKGEKYALSEAETDLDFQQILKYNKPKTRPEVPPLKSPIINRAKSNSTDTLNLVWRFLRWLRENENFLGWTDFHNILSKNNISISTISYLPFLNYPPTDFDTIYTAMVRLVHIAKSLQQEHIIITADLAIYSKAREILWNNPPELDGHVTLQLGGMHLTMAFLASIGYIFGDAGLASILTETDIFAENSCKLMLEGKQYSRAIRGFTIVADALSRLFFNALSQWYETTKEKHFITEEDKHLMNYIGCMIQKAEIDDKNLHECLSKMKDFKSIITDFVNTGCMNSTTFKFWYFFLQTIELLWKMLHAERDGEFESHLAAVYDALPYFSAAGRHLYAKWVPVYLSDMEELKHTAPNMYEFLSDGNFVVKKTSEKVFNCVASDMALEQSINRECKSRSGIIGFSQKPGALLRWMVTRHTLGDYSRNFLGMFVLRFLLLLCY